MVISTCLPRDMRKLTPIKSGEVARIIHTIRCTADYTSLKCHQRGARADDRTLVTALAIRIIYCDVLERDTRRGRAEVDSFSVARACNYHPSSVAAG